MLYWETVSPALDKLLKKLFTFDCLQSYVLVGGTALSLQIGHRTSIDIDLFTSEVFNGDEIRSSFRQSGINFQIEKQFPGGFLGHIDGVKTDFIRHNYPWIDEVQVDDGVRIASLREIAAMKLNAISGSGTRLKDFVDVAFLSGYFTLDQMIVAYEEKYPDVNGVMALKSLGYFNNIDFSTNIDFAGQPVKWKQIEQRLIGMIKDPGKKFDSF